MIPLMGGGGGRVSEIRQSQPSRVAAHPIESRVIISLLMNPATVKPRQTSIMKPREAFIAEMTSSARIGMVSGIFVLAASLLGAIVGCQHQGRQLSSALPLEAQRQAPEKPTT